MSFYFPSCTISHSRSLSVLLFNALIKFCIHHENFNLLSFLVYSPYAFISIGVLHNSPPQLPSTANSFIQSFAFCYYYFFYRLLHQHWIVSVDCQLPIHFNLSPPDFSVYGFFFFPLQNRIFIRTIFPPPFLSLCLPMTTFSNIFSF